MHESHNNITDITDTTTIINTTITTIIKMKMVIKKK